MVQLCQDMKATAKSQMSGGQQQRVAIARALIGATTWWTIISIRLKKLRTSIQYELRGTATSRNHIYLRNAWPRRSVSDEWWNRYEQGSRSIRNSSRYFIKPINRFVADFIGENNIVDGVMKEDYLVEFVGKEFECADARNRVQMKSWGNRDSSRRLIVNVYRQKEN